MSIEQRVTDALLELRNALGDGANIERAIADVAPDYDLQPEVLRCRAEKAFGNLDSVKELVAFQRARASSEASARAIYVKLRASGGFKTGDDPVPDAFVKSLERDFDFSPKEEAGTLAAEQERAAFLAAIRIEFDRVTNDA